MVKTIVMDGFEVFLVNHKNVCHAISPFKGKRSSFLKKTDDS
jgi:hypothetical protein